MSLADRFALLLSALAVGLSALVGARIYENIPHLEDEIAYVWQARLAAENKLMLPTPTHASSFMVPFVVDYQGQRFGKYPPGWPAVLSLGVRAGARAWVNPLLAGLAVWLTYLLGKKVFGETVGLLGAGLMTVSPFFLLNTGSLLSHPLGLVLTTAFALFWFDLFGGQTADTPRSYFWLKLVTTALVFGVLALSRPFSALAISVPFAVHGVFLLIRGDARTRLALLVFGVLALLISSLVFVWQYAVTGSPWLNPYTLWWDYDRIGFGPGVGLLENGHTLRQGWINTKFNLRVGVSDLFGWVYYSWIFLPFGVLALRRNWRGWLVAGIFSSLLVFHFAYWVGAWLFGPRYYFEGLQSLVLISAVGIAWLAGWPIKPGASFPRFEGWKRLRPLVLAAVVALLVSVNVIFYLPARLNMMHDLYGISRADLQPFLADDSQQYTPALIIVHTPRWMPYGGLLDLENPELTTPFIFAIGVGPNTDQQLVEDFPSRQVFHYYPDDPWKFYTSRLP
ncbi:MAG: hypothetical protein ACK2UW_01555 [Anaerolineales bacterium]|jgi:hypothetical protein